MVTLRHMNAIGKPVFGQEPCILENSREPGRVMLLNQNHDRFTLKLSRVANQLCVKVTT